jgi:hypothetical protein
MVITENEIEKMLEKSAFVNIAANSSFFASI